MILLAADTSTAINSVCVSRDETILAETTVLCGRKHAERLLETVDWALAEAGITLDDVDTLAIPIGPGSFTGLRVGISAWKGLALGRGLPLIGVSTLDAMTRLVFMQDGCLCPLIDAKMHEVFASIYHFAGGKRVKSLEEQVCPVETVLASVPQGAIFLGDGATLYREIIEDRVPGAVFAPPMCSVPRASAVATEAYHALVAGAAADAAAINPVYLRQSQPEEMRKKAATP